MNAEEGRSYATNFAMQDPPPPVKFADLLNDSDPRWVSFQLPRVPKSYLLGGSHVRWFTPVMGTTHPSIINVWFTPISPDESFTTEMLGSFADQWGVASDNIHPDSDWTIDHMVAATKAGNATLGTDYSKTPHGFYTSSFSMQIKKALPPEGIKWLFIRAQAKKIQNGRLDAEILILDETRDLVAVSQQTCFFARGPRFKQKSEKL